jgi:hypothetical protein
MASILRASGKPTSFRKDARRKHHHWLVTLYYQDGEKFSRIYADNDKAAKFAARQKKSPVVKGLTPNFNQSLFKRHHGCVQSRNSI